MTLPWFRCRRQQSILLILILASATLLFGQYSTMLLLPQKFLLSITSMTSVAFGSNSDLKWHPPSKTQINNLDSVLHGEGTYGFIYNTSHTPDEQYGTYNWCNMPHARAKEYQKPGGNYELKYVEVVSKTSYFCNLNHQSHLKTPDSKTS